MFVYVSVMDIWYVLRVVQLTQTWNSGDEGPGEDITSPTPSNPTLTYLPNPHPSPKQRLPSPTPTKPHPPNPTLTRNPTNLTCNPTKEAVI